jgi:hypothetical protein
MRIPFSGTISRSSEARHQARFLRSLADDLDRGAPVYRALRTAAEAWPDGKLKREVTGIANALRRGASWIQAVETSLPANNELRYLSHMPGQGRPGAYCAALARHLEIRHSIRTEIAGGLVYPGAILLLLDVLVLICLSAPINTLSSLSALNAGNDPIALLIIIAANLSFLMAFLHIRRPIRFYAQPLHHSGGRISRRWPASPLREMLRWRLILSSIECRVRSLRSVEKAIRQEHHGNPADPCRYELYRRILPDYSNSKADRTAGRSNEQSLPPYMRHIVGRLAQQPDAGEIAEMGYDLDRRVKRLLRTYAVILSNFLLLLCGAAILSIAAGLLGNFHETLLDLMP